MITVIFCLFIFIFFIFHSFQFYEWRLTKVINFLWCCSTRAEKYVCRRYNLLCVYVLLSAVFLYIMYNEQTTTTTNRHTHCNHKQTMKHKQKHWNSLHISLLNVFVLPSCTLKSVVFNGRPLQEQAL